MPTEDHPQHVRYLRLFGSFMGGSILDSFTSKGWIQNAEGVRINLETSIKNTFAIFKFRREGGLSCTFSVGKKIDAEMAAEVAGGYGCSGNLWTDTAEFSLEAAFEGNSIQSWLETSSTIIEAMRDAAEGAALKCREMKPPCNSLEARGA